MRTKLSFLFILLGLVCTVWGGESNKKGLKTSWICWENDTLIKTDRGFTNGLKLTWLSRDYSNPHDNSLFGWMPAVRKPDYRHFFSYSLRQDVFTPDDLKREDLNEEDRPYAGYLNFEAGIHSLSDTRMFSFSLGLGVIGPLALAELAQKFVHNHSQAPVPQGWQHQLGNEPAVQILFESRDKLSLPGPRKGLGFDLITHWGGGLGNVYIYGNAGFQVRIGWNLPHDFGLPLLRPSGSSGVGFFDRDPERGAQEYDGLYFFAALDGQLVLRNIFLDGNTFRDSHHVQKDLLTSNLQIGCGLKINQLHVNVILVKWTRQFKIQQHYQSNVIINIAYSF